MVSDKTELIGNTLEKFIIFKLDFIRKILELNPEVLSEEMSDIVGITKQHTDYNFAAQTVRKLQQKYSKKWF